jgi:predicted dehydrogenase
MRLGEEIVSVDNLPPAKIGMIGAGFMGQHAHLENYSAIPECQVVALAELRPELRRRVAERYEIPRTYATHEELLSDPDVQAVVAVTARPVTGPIALDCLMAGKHLLTEKPMASTVAQSERLVSEASSRDLIYSVGYMRRHDEGIQKAKAMLDELVRTGELGAITFVRMHCFAGDDYCNIDGHVVTDETVPEGQADWPLAPEWLPSERWGDYAYFLNVFCHNINLLRHLLDRTPSVEFVRFENPNARLAVFDFGGYRAVLEAGQSTSRTWDEVTEIYFENGRMRIEAPPALLRNVPARVELFRADQRQEIVEPQSDWTWAFRRQAQAFVTDLRESRAPLASGADAVEDMKTMEAMWRMEVERVPMEKLSPGGRRDT